MPHAPQHGGGPPQYSGGEERDERLSRVLAGILRNEVATVDGFERLDVVCRKFRRPWGIDEVCRVVRSSHHKDGLPRFEMKRRGDVEYIRSTRHRRGPEGNRHGHPGEAAAMVLQTRLNSTSQDLDTLLAQMNSFTLAVTARSHHSSHLRTS